MNEIICLSSYPETRTGISEDWKRFKLNWEKSCWPQGSGGEFINYGFQIWENERKNWLRNANENNEKPSDLGVGKVNINNVKGVKEDEIISHLINEELPVELPKRMPLKELIDLYIDIWEAEDDY